VCASALSKNDLSYQHQTCAGGVGVHVDRTAEVVTAVLSVCVIAMASNNAVTNPEQAKSQGQTSLTLSITGIVISLIVVVVLIALAYTTGL